MKRKVLLSVLALEGFGGILGGTLLVLAPDGHLMDMPTEIMNGAFPNFLIPGLILTAMGILSTVAFFAVFCKTKYDWLLAGLALIGFLIWFAVEVTILHEVHWLHVVWGTPVLIGIWSAISLMNEHKLRLA